MKNTNSDAVSDTASGFSSLGIAPALLAALDRLRFTVPTPIQAQAIPIGIQGKDVIGIAQTGTGKTLAFGIPMIQRLAQVKGQGLVVLPTRELALQVDEVLKKIGREFGLRVAVLIGGASMRPQITALQRKPHVIVATPGRLLDHLSQRVITLDKVSIVVLDEADRMLDMGFAPQIQKILDALPSPADRQTMLFSATMPHEIMKIATLHMKLPTRIEVAPAGTPAHRVTQEIFIIRKDAKNRLLDTILAKHQVTTLIFTRTKHAASRLTRAVRAMGHTAAEIHSNRSLGQRQDALYGFKTGKFRVLIATDIASRGIDVVGIGLVINYDLPSTSADYVHRIGRTARAGAGGHAISFVAPDQRGELRDIERFIKKNLPISELPELPPDRTPVQEAQSMDYPPRRPYHQRPPARAYGSRPYGSRPSSSGGSGSGSSRPRRPFSGGRRFGSR